jgi:hypothetical protein
MWSGPRNISTAMMRSWDSRGDAFVTDEPLYAHYLTKIDASRHPGFRETLAAHEADWRNVVAWLTGPPPAAHVRVWYQKHMAHHLLPEVGLDWVEQVTNCFLIREPREMLASLVEFLPEPTLADTGLPQQVALFRRERERTGATPAVIEGRDVLENPRGMLTRLCEVVDAPFDEAMLSWAPGPRDTDGAWGPFWYAKVYETTGFGKYRPTSATMPPRLESLAQECESLYNELAEFRLRCD